MFRKTRGPVPVFHFIADSGEMLRVPYPAAYDPRFGFYLGWAV
ncbi:hypothetical protein PAMC26577_18535 [Caballeronia sordidicola]|uniref:Uncharacterized protein n=1 Tax=Caballeronia sordidicola TaxID=196367 RepID=A0A242MSD3_CABSO|nr:hypothetical protein PAMC26577_18535 [Caballeronia sordidicola]